MNRRNFILASAIAAASSPAVSIRRSHAATSTTISPLRLPIAGAGRLGFYLDYSELSQDGFHTFYVWRTHGTSGTVSVEYATSGDIHNPQSGILTWGDGEADIKSVSVPIDSNDISAHLAHGLGEHRIIASLLNPKGGALLHRESSSGSWTKAYGIVDNVAMIATEANAWFCDWDASNDGNGTREAPFNNWASVRRAQSTNSKRYIYGRGYCVPGVSTPADEDVDGRYAIDLDRGGDKVGGNDEKSRTYIMSWPGFRWTVTSSGGADNEVGFYSDTSQRSDYITFKNIDFDNLRTTSGVGYAFRARTNNAGWTIESCNISRLRSGQPSGWGAIFLEGDPTGFNVFRCKLSNIERPDGSGGNGIECYDGGTHSISSCTFNQCEVHEKDAPSEGEVGISIRFCSISRSSYRCIRLAGLGANPSPSWHIIQGNILDGLGNGRLLDMRAENAGSIGVGHWIVGNVLYRGGNGSTGGYPVEIPQTASSGAGFTKFIMFNNIWAQCSGHIRLRAGTGLEDWEYLQYNHRWDTTAPVGRYHEWSGQNYNDESDLPGSLGDNYSTGDPRFVGLAEHNVRLDSSSPCKGAGLSGSDKGVYLTGVEVFGAENHSFSSTIPRPPVVL